MLKLLIPKQEKKRFQDIFKFLAENHCEITLFPEGLKYRNHEVNGIIYKNAFVDYPITKTKPLGKINPDKKILNQFFEKWKEITTNDNKSLIEIPLTS